MKNSSELYIRLKTELTQKDSGAYREKMAEHILRENIDLKKLFPLLKEEQKTATRLAWLLSDVCIQSPEAFKKYLPELFQLKDKVNALHFERSVVKFFQLCGVPARMEGKVLEYCFAQLSNSNAQVSIKVHAAETLCNLCVKHPDLIHEVKSNIEDQIPKTSPAFAARAKQLMKRLNKISHAKK